MNRQISKIPNLLSLLRFLISFAILITFMFWIIASKDVKIVWTIITLLFFTGVLSDYLDGYIARKYKVETTFGKFIDPIADKALTNIMMLIILITLAYSYHRLGLMILIPVFSFSLIRDLYVDGYRMVAAKQKIVVSANIWGKIKTISQFLAIGLMSTLMSTKFGSINTKAIWLNVALALFVLSAIFSLASGLIYVKKIRSQLK